MTAMISLYTFEDSTGTPDTYHTYNVFEAEERARKYQQRVIANEYEWTDSEVIFDFTDNPVSGFEEDE